MNLDLLIFGGHGSKSGGGGGSGSSATTSKNKKADIKEYDEAYKFWKKEANKDVDSGVKRIFDALEAKAGGKLGDEVVSVPYKANSAIARIINEFFMTGGTDNFYIGKENGFRTINANRTGMVSFSNRLKEILRKRGPWYLVN